MSGGSGARPNGEIESRLHEIQKEVLGLTQLLTETSAHTGEAIRELRQLAQGLPAIRDEILESIAHERTHLLLALRMIRDDDALALERLWKIRNTASYAAAYEEPEPLISIVIATYMNLRLLRERSLPSIINQTYEHWEAIVVGDAAPNETREVISSLGDDRIRFVNLPLRGPYPSDPMAAWRVTGVIPANTGVALSRGRWITLNSDDDALRPNHFELLLNHARETRSEVAYGKVLQHEPDRPPSVLGVFPPTDGQWGSQNSLVHAGLNFIMRNPTDWIFDIANDVCVLERLLRIGVRFSMVDEIVFDYYPSRMWLNETSRSTKRSPELFMQTYISPEDSGTLYDDGWAGRTWHVPSPSEEDRNILVLSGEVPSVFGEQNPQSLKIIASGTSLRDITLAPGEFVVSVEVPHDDRAWVWVEADRTFVGAELGTNTDKRRLAYRIESIEWR